MLESNCRVMTFEPNKKSSHNEIFTAKKPPCYNIVNKRTEKQSNVIGLSFQTRDYYANEPSACPPRGGDNLCLSFHSLIFFSFNISSETENFILLEANVCDCGR